MDQFSKGLIQSVEVYVPSKVKEAADTDEFAKELITLWEERHLAGNVISVSSEEKCVGFLFVENNCFGRYTIRGTWVAKEFRGQGVGTILMRCMFRYLDHERPSLTIFVNITPGVEEFYKKFGFKIVGTRSDFHQTLGIYCAFRDQKACEQLAKQHWNRVYVAPKRNFFQRLRDWIVS